MKISKVEIQLKDLTTEWDDKFVSHLTNDKDDPAKADYAQYLITVGVEATVGEVSIANAKQFLDSEGRGTTWKMLKEAAQFNQAHEWPYNMHHGVPIYMKDILEAQLKSTVVLVLNHNFSEDDIQYIKDHMMIGYVQERDLQEMIPEEED